MTNFAYYIGFFFSKSTFFRQIYCNKDFEKDTMPGTPLNVHTSWTMVCNSITILLRVAAAAWRWRRCGAVFGAVFGVVS